MTKNTIILHYFVNNTTLIKQSNKETKEA